MPSNVSFSQMWQAVRKCVAALTLTVLVTSGWTFSTTREDLNDEEYRNQRAAWMRSEQSPLALAGLFWLKPGDNTFGTSDGCNIKLREGSGPPRAGVFHLSGTEVMIRVDPKVTVTANGESVGNRKLKTDSKGATPDLLQLGDLRMKVIERGGQFAVRVIDLKNPALSHFTRLNFYPISASYRVRARFKAFREPKRVRVALISGQIEELECPGVAEFELMGKKLQLEPVLEVPGDSKLFFMFKDATNGKETYGGGRYLYSDLPKDGYMNLNFNQAHNPYCAYNSFSTCQVPPLENWLKVPIPAGEKVYVRKDEH